MITSVVDHKDDDDDDDDGDKKCKKEAQLSRRNCATALCHLVGGLKNLTVLRCFPSSDQLHFIFSGVFGTLLSEDKLCSVTNLNLLASAVTEICCMILDSVI